MDPRLFLILKTLVYLVDVTGRLLETRYRNDPEALEQYISERVALRKELLAVAGESQPEQQPPSTPTPPPVEPSEETEAEESQPEEPVSDESSPAENSD